jgi:hypothetical protein
MKNRIPLFEDLHIDLSEKAKEIGLKLKEAVVLTHFFHLHTSNYKDHKILNEFYDKIDELFDEFVEQYQGIYSIITFDGTIEIKYSDPYFYIKEFSTYMEENKNTFTNTLDDVLTEVVQCSNKTLYLLKLNK